MPPHEEWEVVLAYAEGRPDGHPFPTSGPSLTILEVVAVQGGWRERFADGRRYLIVDPGAGELQVRCRYRIYPPHDDDEDPPPHEPVGLFPGARVVRGQRLRRRVAHRRTAP